MAISNLRTTRDFARIWFYWKIPAILIFILIVVGICLYSFTQTPIYESEAKVLLLPKTNDELVVNAGQGRTQYDVQRVEMEDIITEIELIKSHPVLMETITYFTGADLEKASAKIEKQAMKLIDSLVVEPITNSNMISVSLESTNQEKVAEILNKLLEVYISYHKKMFSTAESEAFYSEQQSYYGKKLASARQALKKFNQSNDITNMQGQIDANIGLITQFNGDLQNIEVSIAENEARIKMLENGVKINGNKLVLSREMRNLTIIQELARGLVPLLIKRTEISKTFTKQSREYKQIDDQISMLRQEIQNESQGAAYTDAVEIEALKTKRDELAKRIKLLKQQNSLIDQKQQELNALTLDVDIARKNYLKYGTKTEDSRLYAMRNKTNISNVVVAEEGIRPEKAKSPNKLLAFQVAIFLGLIAAFLLPFLLETIDHKLKTADDIEKGLSVPVVCSYRQL